MVWRNCQKSLMRLVTLLEKKVLDGLSLYAKKRTLNLEEMIFSQEDQPGAHSTLAEIACELNIDHLSVLCIIDQDFDLRPLRKRKVQKLTDSNIENHIIRSRKLLSKYSQKTLHIFSDEKIFKVKQLYNWHNDMVYVPKKMRKVEVPEERLFCKIEAFPKQIMVSVYWFWNLIKLNEPIAKVKVKYCCNVLLKKVISEINRQGNHNGYLFMEDGARAHTVKLTLEML